MKIIMYGADICPDCVEAKELLKDRRDIELDFRSITENTTLLKQFLSYRDHEELFVPVKDKGSIGIPFFILEDGTKTFELSDFIDTTAAAASQSAVSCSLDGKGQC